MKLRIAMIGGRGMPTTYGGVERAIEEMSARLAARGHDVTVYCRSQYCDGRQPAYRGVRLRYLPTIDSKHLEAITHTALATADALTRRFDVLHFHGTGPSLFTPMARLASSRVVATVQGLDYRRDKWGFAGRTVLRCGTWCSARAPHRTVVVSRELQQYFRDRYGIETIYIPNGVDLPHHLPPTPPFGLASGRYLLFLGRLVPEKDVLGLIEAYRVVKSDLPLVVAGPSSHSDDYVSELRRAASRDQRVRLVGPVYGVDKDALLAHAYAFCQPSKLEGLPIALLEALSFGRCAVASDLPEHLEVLRDPLTAAFTFRTGDRESLRSALAAVVARPDRVAAAAAKGRSIVATHYSWDDVADSVEAAYFELAATPSRFQDEIAPT